MSVLKCKICGGSLELTGDASVCVCQYCGTKQTLPKPSDEHSSALYERADHFRRNNDFDKAIQIYEQILNENAADAEAYWLLVLCRYGVEYVEDPKSSKRIATVNRMQYTSVLSDEDYKAALRYADPEQKAIYEAEAHEIDTIQKGILAISQKEEPFDVFICYKETDANGRRTQDSVLANELYHQLTNEGFKVFFSRITLEDKLGSAYEPYIFAALNSAKVMVVLGTKPDYFNAVWVRNEWSRFLSLIKNGANKVLIPAYRDMDPYDLPEEFSHLQAQDMSKLGFMQDLIRGIEKLAGAAKPSRAAAAAAAAAAAPVSAPVAANTDPLLRRLFLFLEDGKWESADEYCEKVLDQNPECGEAYLGKLMIALSVRRREQLAEQAQPFDNHPDYQKAMRFGDEALREELQTAIRTIQNKAERTRLLAKYNAAEALYAAAKTREDFGTAAEAFEALAGFEDAAARAEACRKQAEEVHFGGLYATAAALLKAAKTAEDYQKAAAAFRAVGAYKDAEALAAECDDKAAVTEKEAVYTAAVALMAGGKIKHYKKAVAAFETIRGFKDADIKIDDCERRITEIQAAASVSLAAKEKRAVERKENFKRKLPLIKKVAMVVVPVLILGIVAAMILPTIDFSQLAKSDPTTTTATGKPTTTLGAAATTATTVPTTQGTTAATDATTAGTTEATNKPTGNATGRPTARPTARPTTPVVTPPATENASHAAGCPFASGKYPGVTFKGTETLSWCNVGDTGINHIFWAQGSEGYCQFNLEHTSDARLLRKGEHYYLNNDPDANRSKYIDIHYYENGTVQYDIRCEFYSSGNQKSQIWKQYDANGKFVVETQDECYPSGQTKKHVQIDADGSKVVYEYNQAGITVKSATYYSNGQLYFLSERNEKTNIEKYTRYNEDGSVNEFGTHEYDSKGNQIKWTEYNPDGSIYMWRTYAYDSKNRLTKETFYNSDGSLSRMFEYDSNGHQKKDVIYKSDGSIDYWYAYERNTAGQVIKRTEYKGEKRLYRIFEYDYSKKVVKETCYKEDGSIDYVSTTPLIEN